MQNEILSRDDEESTEKVLVPAYKTDEELLDEEELLDDDQAKWTCLLYKSKFNPIKNAFLMSAKRPRLEEFVGTPTKKPKIEDKIVNDAIAQAVKDIVEPSLSLENQSVFCTFCDTYPNLPDAFDTKVKVILAREKGAVVNLPRYPFASKSRVFHRQFTSSLGAAVADTIILNFSTKTLTREFLKHFFCEHEKDYSKMSIEDMAELYEAADTYDCTSLQIRILAFMASTFSVEKMGMDQMPSSPEKKKLRLEQFTRDLNFMERMRPFLNLRVSLDKREALYRPDGCLFHGVVSTGGGDQLTFLQYHIYERWISQVLVNLGSQLYTTELYSLFEEHDVEYLIWMYNTLSSCSSCERRLLPETPTLFKFLLKTNACIPRNTPQGTLINPSERFMNSIRKLVIPPDIVKRDEEEIFKLSLALIHDEDNNITLGVKVSDKFKIFLLEFLFVLKRQTVNRRLFPEISAASAPTPVVSKTTTLASLLFS